MMLKSPTFKPAKPPYSEADFWRDTQMVFIGLEEEDTMQLHVTYHQAAKEWVVLEDGGKVCGKGFGTKAEAVSYGREISKKIKAELVIHRRDGVIKGKDSYGNDPKDIKG